MLLDVTDVKTGNELLPDGEYVATIKSAELKDTKDGTGQYINCMFVTEDDSTVYCMYNIKNKNEKAVSIGMSQLKSLMLAAGAPTFILHTANDLCGLKCIIKVKKETDSYGEKNKITGYKSCPVSELNSMGSENIPF